MKVTVRRDARSGRAPLDTPHRATLCPKHPFHGTAGRSTAERPGIDTPNRSSFGTMSQLGAYVPDSTTTSASPFVTFSPGALSQETIFPSVIVDERAGMNTSFTAGAETFLFEVAVRDAITPAGRVVFINESCIVRNVKK